MDALIAEVAARYAVAITPAMDALAKAEPNGPVARQFVPSAAELETAPDELTDPIGDEVHSPVKGIVHRYADRVLLKPIHVCPVYCRFCFRREVVGPGSEALTSTELKAALDYIRSQPQIWEVILSGGDPLLLSARRLRDIVEALDAIPHVNVIRLHSRVPVVAPELLDADKLAALRTTDSAAYVAIHANHADEFTPAARDACAALANAGIPLLGQSVLLRGVNDTATALEGLFRTMVRNRIKPYYLHHPDLARGTGHFRLPIERGQEILRGLRGRVSGLCQPSYVLDIPGGHGKVPIGPDYLVQAMDGSWAVADPDGKTHVYPPKAEYPSDN